MCFWGQGIAASIFMLMSVGIVPVCRSGQSFYGDDTFWKNEFVACGMAGCDVRGTYSLAVDSGVLRLGLPDRGFNAASQLLELLLQVGVFLLQQQDLLAQELVLCVDIVASCRMVCMCW